MTQTDPESIRQSAFGDEPYVLDLTDDVSEAKSEIGSDGNGPKIVHFTNDRRCLYTLRILSDKRRIQYTR